MSIIKCTLTYIFIRMMIQYGCAHRAFISNSEHEYQYVQMKTQTFSMYTDMNSSQKGRLQEMTSLNSADKYYECN